MPEAEKCAALRISDATKRTGVLINGKWNVCVVPVADVPIIRERFLWDTDNPEFKKWLSDLLFNLTCNKVGKPYQTKKE